MALACGAECLVCVGCSRWIWKRCTYVGSYDSETWPAADPAEFEAIPRICRQILAVYEDDLTRPQFVPPGGYQIDPACVIKRVTYEETGGRSPPYLIYIDHEAGEVVLAVRGLNLARESDYAVLLDNSLGMQMFDGGFVHHGLLKSAIWLLKRESETLAEIWTRYGGKYKMIFAGHSLGSGVAALMSVIVANYGHWVGGIPRSKLRCFAIAPARTISCRGRRRHWRTSSDQYYGLLNRRLKPLSEHILIIFPAEFGQLAVLAVLGLRERHLPTGGEEAQRSKKALRSRPDVSHCGAQALQVPSLSSLSPLSLSISLKDSAMAAQMRTISSDGENGYPSGEQVRAHRALLQRHVGSRTPLDREGIAESSGFDEGRNSEGSAAAAENGEEGIAG